MKKYFVTYKNALTTFLQYRLNLGLLFFSHIVTFSGVLYLWIAIYSSGQTVGNYSLENIILYYIILTIVLITVANGVGMGFQVSEEINQGNVVNYLLKPYSYPLETLIKLFGEGTINTFFLIPFLIVLSVIGSHYITVPTLFLWLQFLGTLVIAEIFYFLFYFLAALSSFWVVRGRSFVYGMLIVNLMLNGTLLPLDLFPPQYQNISQFLPFQFLIFTPVQTLLGRVTNWPQLFLVAALWIIFLTLLVMLVWNRGIKKFEAVGK